MMDSMKGLRPSESIVNAPATWSGFTRRDVGIDFGVRDVSKGDISVCHDANTSVVHTASVVDEPVPGI